MNLLLLPGLRTQTVEINDQDESGATYYYYGFQSIERKWIIMRQDNTNSATGVLAYRYASSTNNTTFSYSDYATAWAARATLTYDLFYKMKP